MMSSYLRMNLKIVSHTIYPLLGEILSFRFFFVSSLYRINGHLINFKSVQIIVHQLELMRIFKKND